MAAKKTKDTKVAVESYRHESATRKNIPTAKIAAEGVVPRVAKARYSYSAHLSPELRFDASGQSDRVSEIVEKAAAGSKLSKEEADILRGVAANASQPWLEWSGKKEEHDRSVFEVEPVALHIHERVSTNAIIRAAKREDIQSDLFADPQQEYKDAIQFYKHDVDWANRIILGDSLEVMSSLAKRESLLSKVQIIYMDPPYGIRFRSNFQPEIDNRSVGEKDKDMIREPESVRAYRDTWQLGTHSYLSYLRDRIKVGYELLAESGSFFLQIGDDNVHLARSLLDEVFGVDSFVSMIAFAKVGGGLETANRLAAKVDYILWYVKNPAEVTFNQIYQQEKNPVSAGYDWIEFPNGNVRRVTKEEKSNLSLIPKEVRFFRDVSLTKPGPGARYEVYFQGRKFDSGRRWWGMPKEAMERALKTGRFFIVGNTLRQKKYANESPPKTFNNLWDGLGGQSNPMYVVQTNTEVIRRCILMASSPGDLVLDPTCGSGSTAYVSEELGRRWITVDSSRVATSLARQRLITARYPYYRLLDESAGVSRGFVCDSTSLVTVSTYSQDSYLDPLLEKHKKVLDASLVVCNSALLDVSDDEKKTLRLKLDEKIEREGKRSVSLSDQLRWNLPVGEFEHWSIPFDTDPTWPKNLSDSVARYRALYEQFLGEVNTAIGSNSKQIPLLDRPNADQKIIRVNGPFTVEGLRPEEISLGEDGELFDPTPNEWDLGGLEGGFSQNASAYIDRMLQLIEQDGVTFPNNEYRRFALVERLEGSDSALHAEALWEGTEDGDQPNIAIAFGPQHGPVTASQVEDLIRASRRYDELVIAAFSFDGSSQAVIQESANPRLKIHMAHIRPDVSPGMDGLLKDSPKSQLFTVFGQPEIKVHEDGDDFKVELLGVDIYSPLTGEITSSGANKVAAWFLDSDYDGRCFCITQAFFPNQNAWDKIAKALGSSADAEAFEAYNGTISVPFEPGEHQRIAVKVIDPRGNEVMAIRSLKDGN
jgi:adenine-specific DNA-methyltransferase